MIYRNRVNICTTKLIKFPREFTTKHAVTLSLEQCNKSVAKTAISLKKLTIE